MMNDEWMHPFRRSLQGGMMCDSAGVEGLVELAFGKQCMIPMESNPF
jgi:hypothetical protein